MPPQPSMTPLHELITDTHELFEEYRAARGDAVLWTPMIRSQWLSSSDVLPNENVFLKLESEQLTNAFKVRGALNRVKHALDAGAKLIVTASTGNHALAVAHALRLNGASGVLFLPENAKKAKVAALRLYAERTGTGVGNGTDAGKIELRFAGDDCLVAELAAMQYAESVSGAVYISPYNDRLVIAGQGTIGVEIMEFLGREGLGLPRGAPRVCYVTVGGGGLVAGIGSYLKAMGGDNPWRIVGCLPVNAPVMYDSMLAGKVIDSVCQDTLSDGSAGWIEHDSITLAMCKKYVDSWRLVTEEEIAGAMRGMFMHHRKVIEGAAGVAVAGYLSDREWHTANPNAVSVIVCCGANVDPDTFASIIR